MQTCAADSLCVRACPVAIDTGAVMKRARRRAARRSAARATGSGSPWRSTGSRRLTTLRAGLTVVDKVPGGVLAAVTDTVRRVLPTDLVPRVGSDLPGPGASRTKLPAGSEPAEVVFFASCMG